MKRRRPLLWFLISLACFIGAFYFWRLGDKWQAEKSAGTNAPAAPATPAPSSKATPAAPARLTSASKQHESTAPYIPPLHPMTNGVAQHSTNFPYRLSNTAQAIGELVRNNKAILLENALIDSSKPIDLSIPDKLRAHGDPGSYIVQADGVINQAFRDRLKSAGLNIVSYIPNNAYLVTGTAAQVAPFGSSAIPFEPYYKIKSALMPLALAGYKASAVNVAVFPGSLSQTTAALTNLGVTIGTQSPSPFGTELALQNVADLAAVANLSGIEIIEPYSPRVLENDLSRVITSVSTDVFTNGNYLGLTGTNVLVAVNDSWVPVNTGNGFLPTTTINPDLPNIIGPTNIYPQPLFGIEDFAGHGTHVAGIIGCNGNNSPTNLVPGSPQFSNYRGKAPSATLFAMPVFNGLSDPQLQEAAAQTNALISNNSWGYGSTTYDLAAASYDQAVRDSIPGESGSQSLIYVFAAGNNGSGDDSGDGLGGQPDSLSSPGVGKNIITVGASDLPRNITNQVFVCDLCNTNNGCTTNQPWLGETSSSNLVAAFSSRGNVGIGVEGQFGRFKPDLVAPGTFVVSTRSLTWDTNAYYSPISDDVTEFDGDTVDTNMLFNYSLFVPCDAEQVIVTVTSVNPTNIPLLVYADNTTFPTTTTFTARGTNSVSLPPDAVLMPTDSQWFFSVGNTTNVPVSYNIVFHFITTNDLGDYFDVLRTNLNDQLLSSNGGPFYRYETGTSMAAPSVSGVLALMEEYFKTQLQYTPSPALMKALLINGARSINPVYDFQVTNSINYQGWGLVNLTNSLPTNIMLNSLIPAPLVFVDQNPYFGPLATGDSLTYNLVVNSNAQPGNLRITLVWTDPPGNPAASLKLVNNLELIVTNLDSSTPTNPVVYFGNDFQAGSVFTEQWDGDTNNIPYDTINNVQNVYIPRPIGSNYSITVFAKDVNVNAVTANSNGIVQDFAMVVSSDNPDGVVTNALMMGFTPSMPQVINSSYMPDVTDVTNQIDEPTDSGALLLDQLVGASSPLQGRTNFLLPLGSINQGNWGTNGQITVGVTNQWHFYVITNVQGTNATQPFTNAAFLTFLPPDLSIPPTGVRAPTPADSTRPEADIDMFVARSSVFGLAGPNRVFSLTNLNTNILVACDKSLSRGGTEMIVYTNAQPDEVFCIGVQSQDQEAAVYGFAGLFSLTPFSSMDSNGVEVVHGINVPTFIPAATSTRVKSGMTLGIAVEPIEIRRAVVTNHIESQNFGDLFGMLTHSGVQDVLNNHSLGNGSTNQILIYEDNGEGNIVGSQPSDGPGSLRSYIGQQGVGLWTLREFNNALFNTSQVDSVSIRLEPQSNSNGITATIEPGTFFFDFIDVPPEATNLTICVTSDPQQPAQFNLPVDLFVRFGELPTQVTFDYLKIINPPGDCLSIDRTSLPPLKPGRYYIGVFNPNGTAQTVHISWTFGLDVNGVNPGIIVSQNPPQPLIEDAVTNSSILITNQQNIVSVNVGVVLTDPRVSDLDLTLISPTGQRILLFENRGGFSATNMGHLNITTNFFGQVASGGAIQTNNILTNIPPSGVLIVDYNFFTVPDEMDVYDSFGQHIFHSGFISGSNTFTIPYGPGVTFLNIIMNQGNNPATSTLWEYTPRLVSEDFTYLTFTDDTNLTQVPIKFAIPPYDSLDNGTNFALSDFERSTNGDYIATPASPTNNIFDPHGGWTMRTNNVFVRTNFFAGTNLINLSTNFVSVISDSNTAASGSNYLALANGSISRVIPLTPQRNYTISYLYRGPGIAGWWRGEGNGSDSSDPELLANNGDLIGRFNFPAGEVGQALDFEDSGLAFQFAGTNTYVQVRQAASLDVGSNGSGFTVEGWINPTNISFQQPVVEWLAHVPTNTIVNGKPVTNLVIEAGPFLNRANGHYYYLLGQTNWKTSELWANSLGGHLAEVDDANEENFIYDTFAQFGLTNHTMWIGLTNNPASGNSNFFWSTGSSLVYANWGLNQPTNCSPAPGYVAILGPTNALPGLWAVLNNNGFDCSATANAPFGVAEVVEIQTNGVQLWISVTNSVTNNVLTGNGRLYANIMDTSNVVHEIFSAPGLIQTNVFQHVALTYNTNTGVAQLFYNGTNVLTTNIGVFIPNTGGDVLLGKDMSRVTNNFYWGLMDEMSIYSRYLSDAEIAAIYNVSASTSNRNIGKFDPGITPALSLAEAQAVFGGVTNLIYGVNQAWQIQGFTLKAQSNTLPVQITGLEPGVLLDSFFVSEQPPGNLYYLPEQALNALVGSNAFGNWTLEIRDSRTGAIATDAQLISWELQFVLETNTPTPIQLVAQTPATNTIPPGQVGYFVVNVPDWANDATNILISSKDNGGNPAPVSMYFNQFFAPLSGAGLDVQLVANSSGGLSGISPPLQAVPPSFPPLLPGQSYNLAITNPGPTSATVVIVVDFDITTLSNGVPLTVGFGTNNFERPFVFNVTTNASEATFQLLQMTGGNADLVLRKGLPIPSLISADYGGFNGSNATETIYVLTNSLPVPLSAGPWYLDVFKRVPASDTATNGLTMRYAVLAKELDPSNSPAVPNIIDISNRVPFTFTAGPGAALTNFFRFSSNNFTSVIRSNVTGIHFELYNQSGNGDLTVQTNAPPLAPPFFRSSQSLGNAAEFIFMPTNAAPTNFVSLTNLMTQDCYLGVPNNETNPITYTILAVIDTNIFPSFPAAEGAGAVTRGGAFGTNVYHVTTLNDSGSGSLRDAVTSTNGGGTVVFDVSGTISNASPLFLTNSFFTIAGQTAPGTNGITIAGAPTYIQGVSDIILRYLRFRPAGTNIMDSLQITNSVNIIADHVSVAFGTSNVVSILNSSNITVQWSVLADSLNITNSFTGGTSVRFGGGDVTLHHNLYSDNYSGNPTLGEDVTLDFVNNVIYNWGLFAGLSTNDLVNNPGGVTNFLNYAGNYLIAGTNSFPTNGAFFGSSPDTFIFQTNNFIDTNLNFVLDGANTSWGMFSNQFTEFSAPFATQPIAPDESFIAYERVLDFAGASMDKRDAMDRGTVEEVRLFGGSNAAAPAFLSGMATWWKAEFSTVDSINGNIGTVNGGVTYSPGEVGQAFNFDGTSGFLTVPASPSLDIGQGSGITIECWIAPDHLGPVGGAGRPIVEYDTPTQAGVDLWFENGSILYANVMDTTNNLHQIFSAPNTIQTNVLQHVALTYDKASGQAFLYINGAQAASQNFGTFTPQTSFPLNLGLRSAAITGQGSLYNGLLDELSLYSRALTPCEIAAIYNAGHAGKQSLLSPPPAGGSSAAPFVDVDKDGIPDFWEITLGENVTNFSPNADRDGDGYTDLEEYLNWLGAPHALTLTNTTTNIDLYVLSGKTGDLTFGVQNGTNGTVYLTNGPACSEDPASSEIIAVFTPTNALPFGTNGGFASFGYMVTNMDTLAYFGPVTVSVFVSSVPITNASVFSFPNPPDIRMNPNTTLLVTNSATPTNGVTYVLTNSPGWATIDPNTGVITLSPTNGPSTNVITTIATDTNVPPDSLTNTFTVIVNGPPVFILQPPPNLTNSAFLPITVTNAATDPDMPPNVLFYQLIMPPSPTNATIGTNTGVITWTPTPADLGTNLFETVVTDTNGLSATNFFYVVVTAPIDPFAFTQPVQGVTGPRARFNGMATPNGIPSVAWFDYGTNTSYSSGPSPIVNVGSGTTVVYVQYRATGLTPNVPYHYRLTVSNALAVVHGFDQILDVANVVAWGANFQKQVQLPPVLNQNVTEIAGAYDHSLAVLNNQTVVAWGDNTFNQANVPVTLNNVLAVAGGQYSSMALVNAGTVTAWGANVFQNVTNVPNSITNVIMIAAGADAGMALNTNGNIKAWGANFSGLTNVPPGLTIGSNIVEIASGQFHALAIKNDGTVAAWGLNNDNQTNVPAGLSNVVQVAGGNFHSLALKSDGTVVAWGYDNDGQTDVPAGLSNVVAIAAGGLHSMALKSDGSVVGWGDNSVGQTTFPVGLSNVVAIAAGNLHSLALTPLQLVGGTNVFIVPSTNGSPQTNTVLPGQTLFYQVNVPGNADFSTNSFFTITPGSSLAMWFTTNTPPTITNVNDYLLISNAPSGSATLSTSSTPHFVPTTTYYLGVQNTNAFPVSDVIEVDFHFTLAATLPTNTAPVSIIHTNISGTNGYLIYWFAPSNDLFEVQWSPVLPVTNWNTFTNPLPVTYNVSKYTNNPNSAEFEFFDDGSQTPGGLGSNRFYQVLLIGGGTSASTVLSNSVPQTNGIPAGQTAFYQITVPTNAVAATNLMSSISGGPLNIWFSTNAPPTIGGGNDFLLISNSLSGSSTIRTNGTTPTLIDGGTYYLGVQNTNAGSVIYSLAVNFGFAVSTNVPPTNAPVSIVHTNMNGTNGFLLTWFAPSNDLFAVQWTPILPPTNWNTFTNPLPVTYNVSKFTGNPNNTEFEFFDDGTQTPGGFGTNRFYQIILLNGSSPLPPVLPSGVPQTNSVPAGQTTFYQVNVPTNAVFATNTLISVSGSNLNVWFSTNSPPTITNGNDFLLISNAASGTNVLGATSTPLLNSGKTYYLGVQNTNTGPATFGILVSFALSTNGPSTNTAPISIVRTNISAVNGFLLTWFAPSNDSFQVQWTPVLPVTNWNTFTNPPQITYNVSKFTGNPNSTEFEFFDDGSQTPGGLGSNRFYQVILLNGSSSLPFVIPLTNGVALPYTTLPGQTNFFSFDVTQNPGAVLFELYNLNNYALMNLQPSNLPVSSPYFASSSVLPSTNYQQIVLRTNGVQTNLNATFWYLGVPNTNGSAINYTIRAVLQTNGILVSGLPIGTKVSQSGNTNIQLAWSPAVSGESYAVLTNTNLATSNWVALATNMASGTSMAFTNQIPAAGSPALFYWVVQVP
jgi:subtilisin-like proprotein convertase family protein